MIRPDKMVRTIKINLSNLDPSKITITKRTTEIKKKLKNEIIEAIVLVSSIGILINSLIL
jgi:tRNA G10  N-methylase Trm11